MTTYINTSAVKNAECTSIGYARGEIPTEPGNWIECDELELDFSSASKLFRIGNTEYFGWL